MKVKHNLNGNMDFVGEILISGILRDRIAKDIFGMLLEKESRTDDTIEAALRFINKIGKALEEKHKSQKVEKQKFTADEYKEVLDIFREIMKLDVENGVSTRIKMLAINMIENQESGWQK